MNPFHDLMHIDRALTPQERRLLYRTRAKGKQGYAAPPGTGPIAETCKSCKHYVSLRTRAGNTFPKCRLMESIWTHGPGTDIKASSPACSRWERP